MLKAIFAIAIVSLFFFSTSHSSSGPEPEISPELKKIADCAYLNHSNVGEACVLHLGFYEDGVFSPADIEGITGWREENGSIVPRKVNAELVECSCAGVSLRLLPELPPAVINLTMNEVQIEVLEEIK